MSLCNETTNIFVAATGNRHKIEEIAAVMRPFGIEIISKDEAGVSDFEPEETGSTFEENAYIKAKAVAECVNRPVIAEDSGLAVDALDGAPGVFSARFSEQADIAEDELRDAGSGRHEADQTAATGSRGRDRKKTGCADADNNAKLLELLESVPDGARTAKFVSVITLLYPDGVAIVARGECKGRIIREERGTNGFGYDPLFVPAEYDADGRTFAQLSPDEKNVVSHRARALEELREKLAAKDDEGKEKSPKKRNGDSG
jgi:XTP/dITP diphosphohydrolase